MQECNNAIKELVQGKWIMNKEEFELVDILKNYCDYDSITETFTLTEESLSNKLARDSSYSLAVMSWLMYYENGELKLSKKIAEGNYIRTLTEQEVDMIHMQMLRDMRDTGILQCINQYGVIKLNVIERSQRIRDFLTVLLNKDKYVYCNHIDSRNRINGMNYMLMKVSHS